MSLKKKLFGAPATLVGIFLGVLVGGLAVVKELFQQKSPIVGLIIMGAAPLAAFFFEQVMSRAFPESYWENLAGRLVSFYRYVINEDFRLKFFYEMRFAISDQSPRDITSELLCETFKAEAGGDPEPASLAQNFLHLRFRETPFLIAVHWHLEESDDEDVEDTSTVFRITMEPEIRELTMRKAKDDVEGTIARLNKLEQGLTVLFRGQPDNTAVADAWFGKSMPPSTPIRRIRKDSVSGGEYRIFPGLLHVAGTSLSALGAVHRYVGGLEPPPDPEDDNA
ncbi:MAG TPA: hypothetical protein VEM96_18225 [Pyrinomonadaceae bacterium]|nr:hypothetical protein [Pyrinomonadaceae bacterium]